MTSIDRYTKQIKPSSLGPAAVQWCSKLAMGCAGCVMHKGPAVTGPVWGAYSGISFWLSDTECSHTRTHARTHARAFNGPFSRITRVSRYQKGKTSLDFTQPRDSESCQLNNWNLRFSTRTTHSTVVWSLKEAKWPNCWFSNQPACHTHRGKFSGLKSKGATIEALRKAPPLKPCDATAATTEQKWNLYNDSLHQKHLASAEYGYYRVN